jgi:hypothetical protein
LASCPTELAMRSPTASAKMTESGKTGPAKLNPTRSEKATAAAGAMCVIDWNNTCAKPMECSRKWSNLCPDSTSYLLTLSSGTAVPKDTLDAEHNATRIFEEPPFCGMANTHLTRIIPYWATVTTECTLAPEVHSEVVQTLISLVAQTTERVTRALRAYPSSSLFARVSKRSLLSKWWWRGRPCSLRR